LVEKTLVTTSLKDTWPERGSILFLGSWCWAYSDKELLSSIDYKVLPYHWDDRMKLQEDFTFLESIYEKKLCELSLKLNKIHGKEHTQRFWRILIGPWLYTFIDIIFDRWYTLQEASEIEDILDLNVIDRSDSHIIPNDYDHFNEMIETDEWNEGIYGFISENFFKDKFRIKKVKIIDHEKPKEASKDLSEFKKSIFVLLNLLSKLFSREEDVFIIASHMSLWRRFLLSLSLKQFPSFWYRSNSDYSYDEPSNERNLILESVITAEVSEFEKVLNAVLLKFIPKVYLEGFGSLNNKAFERGWPKSPKAIFTSNAYASDEIFKCWAGRMTDSGYKLLIGQHGGNFGMTPMAIHETHQIKISDKWFSWGWERKEEPKIVPVGNFKSKFSTIKHKQKGDALLVGMTLPKYSYYLYSVPIAGQVETYLDEQIEFVQHLPSEIQEQIRVRLYSRDRGWDQRNRWIDNFNKIKFDDNNRSIINSFKSSRIFIGTYNATTFLEAFSVNMPSILFWNSKHWELTYESDLAFQKLKDVGIMHLSPRKAAIHLGKIWNNVDEWWFDKKVQAAVNNFIQIYSKQNPNFINELKNNILN